jgi:hypothetical protein
MVVYIQNNRVREHMKWTGRFTTEQFRSRCADCPDRTITSCILAQMVLGEDYRPDTCVGANTEIQRSSMSGFVTDLFGEDARFIGAITNIKRVCGQDLRTIPGEFTEASPPQAIAPPPAQPNPEITDQ